MPKPFLLRRDKLPTPDGKGLYIRDVVVVGREEVAIVETGDCGCVFWRMDYGPDRFEHGEYDAINICSDHKANSPKRGPWWDFAEGSLADHIAADFQEFLASDEDGPR